jgi:hypothetical protein
MIVHQRQDSFGSVGDPEAILTLPRDTHVADLAKAMLMSLRLCKRGIPLASPWRWGLAKASVTTMVADELSARGLLIEHVSRARVQAVAGGPGSRRSLSLLEPPEGGYWCLLVEDREEQSDLEAAVRFGQSEAPAFIVAAALSQLQPDVGPLDIRRLGLNDWEFPRLAEVARTLDAAGMRPVRADLDRVRRATGGHLFASAEVLTMIDKHQHLLSLAMGQPRETGAPPWWRLYALGINDAGIAQPVSLTMAETTDWWWCGDPFGVADPAITSEALAWAVGRASSLVSPNLATIPLEARLLQVPSNLDTLFQVFSRGPAANRLDRPEPVLIRSPYDAEKVAAHWMRWMGFADATETMPGADGGIDVESATALAQVKTETLPVGRPALQRLAGAAHAERKRGLFFSLSGYTAQAREWADQASIAIFTFDLQGVPQPINRVAEDLFGG